MTLIPFPDSRPIIASVWAEVVMLWTVRLGLTRQMHAAAHLEQWLRANGEGVVS